MYADLGHFGPRPIRISWFALVFPCLMLNYFGQGALVLRDPDIYQSSVNGPLFVPANNPYNPFGERFWSPTGAPNADGTPRLTGTPTAVNVVNHRFWDFGARADTVTNRAYRVLSGVSWAARGAGRAP